MGDARRKSRVSFASMSGDLLLLTVLAGGLAAAYAVWHSSLEAREAANRIAREACSRAVVQFLDETVAFSGFRLVRSPDDGRRRLLRTYTFDYTSDGFERAQGFVLMSGRHVEAVGLAGRPS
jgi:hypothetical protein